jgi:hypothetical protein
MYTLEKGLIEMLTPSHHPQITLKAFQKIIQSLMVSINNETDWDEAPDLGGEMRYHDCIKQISLSFNPLKLIFGRCALSWSRGQKRKSNRK